MTTVPGFTVDVDHNPYLPVSGRHVSAVVTVTADASGGTPAAQPGAAGNSAEILIVDCSLSMGMPRAKIAAARSATAAAVDVIRAARGSRSSAAPGKRGRSTRRTGRWRSPATGRGPRPGARPAS